VPIPGNRHPSKSVLICEPYLEFKDLSRGRRGRRNPHPPGGRGEKKKPQFLGWGFFIWKIKRLYVIFKK
jgi:hypothetical protein